MLGLYPPEDRGQNHYIKTDRMNINIRVIQRWISVCDSDHKGECRDKIQRQFLPHPPSLILIDVENRCIKMTKESPKYTALSYVWGKSNDVFVTTMLNKDQLSEKRSLSSRWHKLPATVKDAILLTKALDIPFLWVDRLCIVQDDEESIKHNISWMASIYANAYFTIIATEGVDDEFGLRGIGSTSGPRDFFPFFQFENVELAQEKLFEHEQVWHSRAWTFQERAVSRRCLVFFHGTVKWECQQCEHHEHLSSSTHLAGGQKYYPRHNISFAALPDYDHYSALCSGFSRRNIRYQKDALKAFTAVINSFAPSFPGGFFYALPEFAFDYALAWTHESVASRRPMFPSWSWIGWSGATHMGNWALQSLRRISRHPMVQWSKKRVDTGSMELINNRYHLWHMFENNANKTLPKDWKRDFIHGKMYYRYDGDLPRTYQNGLDFNYKHPLPVTSDTGSFSIPSDTIVSEPFLYGIVQSTVCTLRESIERRPCLWGSSKPKKFLLVNIYNRRGSWIGTMDTNITSCSAYTPGTECVVIAISRVTQERESWNEMEELITRPHLAAENSYEFIQVLWVSWEGSIAYRRGLGRIWEKAWKLEETSEIQIVLG